MQGYLMIMGGQKRMCWWMFLMIISVSLLSTCVKGQRVDYCFPEGQDPCQPNGIDVDWVAEEETLDDLCHEKWWIEYAQNNETLATDPTFWAQALAEVPANSNLCDQLQRYLPHCWYCAERPCGFGPGGKRPLTCDGANEGPGTGFFFPEDARQNDQETCYWLGDFIYSFGGVVEDVSTHAGALEIIVGIEPLRECDNFQQVYSRCYWCMPEQAGQEQEEGKDTTIEEPIEEGTGLLYTSRHQCSFDSLCANLPQGIPQDFNVSETQQTCQEIEFVIHRSHRQILTMDTCEKAPLALATTCPQYCHPCFTPDDPPSCEAPTQDLTDRFNTSIYQVIEADDFQFGNQALICSKLGHIINYESRSHAAIADPSTHLQALSGFRANSPICDVYRYVYHDCFWCDDTHDVKDFDCSNQPFCQDDDAAAAVFEGSPDEIEQFEAACQDLQALLEPGAEPYTIDLCQKSRQYSQYCACEGGPETNIAFDYLGADSTAKKRVLVWMPRIAAFLSFVGASYILWEVLSNYSNRGIVYYQLLASMAIFDMCTAFAWAFSTAPIPDYNVEGANGTDGTCIAQGFFIQLGFTSIFFNVALAAYYWLVIVKSYKEFMLRTIRLYLFVPPLVVGATLAFAGIPFYQGFDYACHIQPYPYGELWQVLLFAVIPIAGSILLISGVMVKVYLTVREQSLASRRWTMRFGASAKMERQVFWQAFFYTMSFYITWPIVLCVYVTGWDFEKHNFGFAVLVSFVAPLQGFNNAMVFVRPKLRGSIGFDSTYRMGSRLVSRFFGSSQLLGQKDSDSKPRLHCGSSSGSCADDDDDDELCCKDSAPARSMDPSAVIAFDEFERNTESIGKESTIETHKASSGAEKSGSVVSKAQGVSLGKDEDSTAEASGVTLGGADEQSTGEPKGQASVEEGDSDGATRGAAAEGPSLQSTEKCCKTGMQDHQEGTT